MILFDVMRISPHSIMRGKTITDMLVAQVNYLKLHIGDYMSNFNSKIKVWFACDIVESACNFQKYSTGF